MNARVLRFAVLLLSTLTVGMKFAHVLELPPKLQLPPDVYIAVQSRLYRLFGTIGPVLDVAMVVATVLLAIAVFRTPSFRYTLAGLAAMVLSLLVWLVVVFPANMPLQEWAASGAMPADWERWRNRWQYGQLASFLCDAAGYCLVLFGVLRESPARPARSLAAGAQADGLGIP